MLYKISTSYNIKCEEVSWVSSNIYNTKVKVSYDDLVSKHNHNVSLSECQKLFCLKTSSSLKIQTLHFTPSVKTEKVVTLTQQFSSEMGLNKTKF